MEWNVQDMKGAMKKLLLTFYNKNGRRKPKRLVFYRDGVSEGQFAEVQYCEIPQIRAACMEVCPPPPPTLLLSSATPLSLRACSRHSKK